MHERRRYVRVTPEEGAPVRVDINGENFLDILCACDISEGGVGFQVEHCFTGCMIDKPVHFIVQLPPPVNALISAEGRIRHVAGQSFGIEFEILTREARHNLFDYVHHRLRNAPLLTRVAHSLHLSGVLPGTASQLH